MKETTQEKITKLVRNETEVSLLMAVILDGNADESFIWTRDGLDTVSDDDIEMLAAGMRKLADAYEERAREIRVERSRPRD